MVGVILFERFDHHSCHHQHCYNLSSTLSFVLINYIFTNWKTCFSIHTARNVEIYFKVYIYNFFWGTLFLRKLYLKNINIKKKTIKYLNPGGSKTDGRQDYNYILISIIQGNKIRDIESKNYVLNPFVPPQYSTFDQNFNFNLRILKKISYERCVYESVAEKSLS